VFVDVTADWCITCKANKIGTLLQSPTYEHLQEKNVVLMRGDWTTTNSKITEFLMSHRRYGVPLNAVYGPNSPLGTPLPVLLVNVYVPLQQQIASGTNTNSAFYALKVWEKEPEKFAEVHRQLVAHPTRHDAGSLNRIAKDTGTEKYLETGEREQSIVAKNMQAFSELGLRGTPAIIINDEIVPGFIPYGQLKETVDKALN
jgi:hypothetical protein